MTETLALPQDLPGILRQLGLDCLHNNCENVLTDESLY